MSLNDEPWPGRVVEINFHEVDSQLRMVDSQGTSAVLISCEGNVRETVERYIKC